MRIGLRGSARNTRAEVDDSKMRLMDCDGRQKEKYRGVRFHQAMLCYHQQVQLCLCAELYSICEAMLLAD